VGRRRVICSGAIAGGLCVGLGLVAYYGIPHRQAGDPQEKAPADPRIAEVLEAYRTGRDAAALEITYPPSGAVFPPEIVAPTFRWQDASSGADVWLVSFEFPDGGPPMGFFSRRTQWTPSTKQWEILNQRCRETEAEVLVLGVREPDFGKVLSAGRIAISTSDDEVGAPLFYREVNLPFIDAVKDPSRIRWRWGRSEQSSRTAFAPHRTGSGRQHSGIRQHFATGDPQHPPAIRR